MPGVGSDDLSVFVFFPLFIDVPSEDFLAVLDGLRVREIKGLWLAGSTAVL